MGCSSSSGVLKTPTNSTSNATSKSYKTSNLSSREIELRISAPQKTESFIQSDIKFKYAYVSQRGYYPDSLEKENQDSYSILSSLNKEGGL